MATPTPTRTRMAPPPTSTPTSHFYWREEAEHGALAGSMVVGRDQNASGCGYIYTTVANSGIALFSIDVPHWGRYYLWGRARGEGWTANSFVVSIDDLAEARWEIRPESGPWAWQRVTDEIGEAPVALDLWINAGNHILSIKGRELRSELDCLLLTDEGAHVPSEVPTYCPGSGAK